MHFLLICSSKYLICEEGVVVVGTRDISFIGDRERAKKRKGPIPALTRSAGKISSAVAKSHSDMSHGGHQVVPGF